MGFYSPSQLVQDARRHQVAVQPIDINCSEWDHGLEDNGQTLRLGLRLVSGLSREGAKKILAARPDDGYTAITQIHQLASPENRDMEQLASAGAFKALTANRHQARWDILGHETPAPLFIEQDRDTGEVPSIAEDPSDYKADSPIQLPSPSEGENILEDYASNGLTLRRHPLALLREQGHLRHCRTAEEIRTGEPGRPVQVAGLVTGRQRPGSAAGVTFVTLEDETGNVNVVVWLNTARQQRQPLLKAKLLHVKGVLEREGDIAHVMAGKLSDLSHLIQKLNVSSRDFH
jgi:error-prone DNA polymerase